MQPSQPVMPIDSNVNERPQILVNPVAQKQQSDVSMKHEEEKVGPVENNENAAMCRYCNNPISPADESSGNFGMFTETFCFHSYHVNCFKTYAVKEMLKYKKQGQDPIFNDPKCSHCNVVIPEIEVRQIFGP